MKKMSFEEFQKRTEEVAKAHRIYGNLTNNISESFAIYQEVLAEEKMDVFVSTAQGGNRPLSPIDGYERPVCPECGEGLRLKLAPVDADGKPWNTAWVCVQCQAEFYSNNTINDWMTELKRKDVSEQ